MASNKGPDYYVSPNGNDAWSGTLAKPNMAKTNGPFASVKQAQVAARKLSKSGKSVTVALRGGTYQLNEPIIFTSDDSGTHEAPVLYTAYSNEKPILSGGRKITGWKKKEGGIWTVEVPDVKAGKWYFGDLYVNEERRFRPRLPKEGDYKIAESLGDKALDAFKYTPGDIKPMHNQEDVELVGFNAWDELRMRIKSLDEEKHIVTFTGSNNWAWGRWGNRYYLENVREAFGTPGEWYLDRKTGVLSYTSGEDMTKAEVIAPVLEDLVHFQGDAANGKYVENIKLNGIGFQYSGWSLPADGYTSLQAAYKIPGVIEMNDTRSCTISNCQITHVGKYGIEMARGCSNNLITKNSIHDMGAGGVKIGETIFQEKQALRTGRNIVTHNSIFDGGKTYLSAVGVWIGQSGSNNISYNLIHDLYYTGVSVGWTWGYGPSLAVGNKIEYNHIYNIGRGLLSDMGGIYTLGVSPGTVLTHNLIHDVQSYSYGGWGIYNDEGSSGIVSENNLIYNTKTSGFHQHYGEKNYFRNNIIAFAKEAQIQRSRLEEHIPFFFEHNIVYWTEGGLLSNNWLDKQIRTDNNIYWNAAGKPFDFAGKSFDEWKAMGNDVHSIIADPLFVDAAKYDFRLKPNSPVDKIGFKPFDLKGVPGAPFGGDAKF